LKEFDGNSNKLSVECPWCHEKQEINSMPNNMIMAFNCKHCDEPIVVIQEKPLKIDKKVLETGDILKLQEYILDLLDKEFNISAEINKVEQLQDPFGDSPKVEKTKENFKNKDKSKKKGPIAEEEIEHMKNFLENYKIPRTGDMFDEFKEGLSKNKRKSVNLNQDDRFFSIEFLRDIRIELSADIILLVSVDAVAKQFKSERIWYCNSKIKNMNLLNENKKLQTILNNEEKDVPLIISKKDYMKYKNKKVNAEKKIIATKANKPATKRKIKKAKVKVVKPNKRIY